jgi:hypothetical protein
MLINAQRISSLQNAFAVDRPMHWTGDAGIAAIAQDGS